MKKLIKITTVPISLNILLKGQLSYLSKYYEILAVSSFGADLIEVQKREDVKIKPLFMCRNINIIRDVISLILLIKLFHKEKPFIVHANTPKASFLSMIAALICRVPHRIYTVTGLRFETANGYFQRLLIAMECLTCACATKVIPEGEGVKRSLINNKITTKPLKVILNGNINGIDIDYFNKLNVEKEVSLLSADLNLSACFTFCFVGRLVGDKGINELVAAFNRLQQEYTDVRLLLVGGFEAELDPLHKRTIEVIDNSDNIIAVGHQKDVRPYLAVSNVFTFGSYREGFPNVVMQAGAMDLPCIVTDINGCNEIIIEGKNGLIVPPKNSDALYEAMKKLYLDKSLREEMSACARELIISRYEQKMVWEALLAEYKSLEK